MRVAQPPPKPLLIWDGECHFCHRWIERWQQITGDKIDYATSQKIAAQFPEIPAEEFQRHVILVLPNGEVHRAAEAVYRSLALGGRRWPLKLYQQFPAFAAVSEFGYARIAKHRTAASYITRALWGKDVRPPTYFITRNLFLRALGLIYLVAFISLWAQLEGLIGSRGILPAADFFSAAHSQLGARVFYFLPSLLWLNASDAALHLLCALGVVASIALTLGFVPIGALVLCFVSYLSLTVAGQDFLSFQWDILLLETGFLAIFFAPGRWRLTRSAPVSVLALFLLKFLLFKLMFMSGVVKLTSGDTAWGWVDGGFHWNALTALNYHYWTQPLPTVFAWFADKSPEWFKKFSVAFCLFVEIIVPFFIWAPRHLRLVSAGLLILLQIIIAITGNYCFFNLIAIALCLLLIDDATWRRAVGAVAGRVRSHVAPAASSYNYFALVVLIITLPFNLWLCYTAIKPESPTPRVLASCYGNLEPFRIVNGYGLFRVMTRERPEIQIEGSADGIDWVPYEFKWKPGDVNRAQTWCAPHQPRLDWQMWFAALGGARQEAWFQRFILRLLQNEPSVTHLLARNPFPASPPRYVRAILYKYEFTTSEERRTTGAWWKRREIGEFFPEVSLSNYRR